MPGSHYSDFSARNRRFLGDFSARNQHGLHYNDFSAISRREIGDFSPRYRRENKWTNRASRDQSCDWPWHLWILDNNRLYIAISLLLLVGSTACGQLIAIRESWVLHKNNDCGWGAVINIIHAVSYARMLCWYNVGTSCIDEAEFTNFIRMNKATFDIPLVLGNTRYETALGDSSQEKVAAILRRLWTV